MAYLQTGQCSNNTSSSDPRTRDYLTRLFIPARLSKKPGLSFSLYDTDALRFLNDVVGDAKTTRIKQAHEWHMMSVWITSALRSAEDSAEITDDEYDALQEVFWVNADWSINKEPLPLQNDDLVHLRSGLVKLLGVAREKVPAEKKEFYDFRQSRVPARYIGGEIHLDLSDDEAFVVEKEAMVPLVSELTAMLDKDLPGYLSSVPVDAYRKLHDVVFNADIAGSTNSQLEAYCKTLADYYKI